MLLTGTFWFIVSSATAADLNVAEAQWDAAQSKLKVDVTGDAGTAVVLVNARDFEQFLASGAIGENEQLKIRINEGDKPVPVPCRVLAVSSEQLAIRDVQDAPLDCAPKVGEGPEPPAISISSEPGGPTYTSAQIVDIAADVSSSADVAKVEFYDNGVLQATDTSAPYSYAWSISDVDNGPHGWSAAVYDVENNIGTFATLSLTVNIDDSGNPGNPGGPAPDISINSTSQNSLGAGADPYVVGPVTEEPTPNDGNSLTPAPGSGDTSHQILAVNDLGMHCGDFDTRVASILPPFQVKLSQVIRKGDSPDLLGPSDVEVLYSAASNPDDPILSQGAEAFTGLTPNGDVYKTNFWDVVTAYDPFYPPGLLCADPGDPATCTVNVDTGLPVPNVEHLYIGSDGIVNSGDETLSAVQHAMPGVANPYIANNRQLAEEHYGDKPFFVNFPFGYVANDVNWFEGSGIPFAAFDDFGRENAYPLVRVQAKEPGANGQVLATVDTVLPISGEASCKNCHGSTADVDPAAVATAGIATGALPEDAIASSMDDDLGGTVPVEVSVEYATDINILRLHDLRHGGEYRDSSGNATACDVSANPPNGDANCLASQALDQGKPVVCQVCHYTPALDLAQLGPLGGTSQVEDPDANGRVQRVNKSNSRVMHYHHGALNQEPRFAGLFPPMPAPEGDGQGGLPTNHLERDSALEQTCYQCHPGTKTKCLRGAMANGGMVCQDCHGGMLQVGDDFTANLSASAPFLPDGTNADLTKRVPWANEPGCGSCHTGDVRNNLADPDDSQVAINAIDSYGNPDGLRLIRAYLDLPGATTTPSSDTADTTPIVPSNKRFAEPSVPESFNGFLNPGAGNPKLYRVSTGHGGVFCEGCHGATHAEWDSDGSPIFNDNITANQLQGHSGTVTECGTCHTTGAFSIDDFKGSFDADGLMKGPHGMHPVDDPMWTEKHKAVFKDGQTPSGTCQACHGNELEGTVLARTAADRVLECKEPSLPGCDQTSQGKRITIKRGTQVSCAMCHKQPEN